MGSTKTKHAHISLQSHPPFTRPWLSEPIGPVHWPEKAGERLARHQNGPELGKRAKPKRELGKRATRCPQNLRVVLLLSKCPKWSGQGGQRPTPPGKEKKTSEPPAHELRMVGMRPDPSGSVLGSVGVWAAQAQRAALGVFGARVLLGPVGAQPAGKKHQRICSAFCAVNVFVFCLFEDTRTSQKLSGIPHGGCKKQGLRIMGCSKCSGWLRFSIPVGNPPRLLASKPIF